MRKLIFGALLAALPLLVATSAEAAKPRHQACLGEDFSSYARVAGGLGSVVTGFTEPDGTRTIEGGLGTAIQAWLAGAVPEDELPNTCND
ncbi:MAG: hypothetical protein WD942_05430 [Dehalococcoidia bacterium]